MDGGYNKRYKISNIKITKGNNKITNNNDKKQESEALCINN